MRPPNGLVSAPGRPASILIADDDSQMRELLLGLVEDLGYRAQAVPDGPAALAVVDANPPDLVLSDVGMPGLNGFDLCRRLKAGPATRLIPVVLITAIGEEYKAAGIEAGADDFLSKPVQLGELRVRIRSLLRMKAYTDELESAEAVLCTLAKSIEAKDYSTGDHCERLADLGVLLGRDLGLGESDLTALRRGGYLHDLGKVAVPEAILLKPGPLSAAEREVVQRHPAIGEEICRPLRSLREVLPIIRHHHERRDGSGYPDGLRGEAIPLTARILQVADIFDALTTDRPYRQALPPDRALDVLDTETQRGWWDPEVVRTFRSLITNGNGDGQGKKG
jgi:putative two-component system response regulator